MESNAFLQEVAQNYLQYLTASDKGIEKIKIRHIEKNMFGLQLQLDTKLKSVESLALRTAFGEFLLNDSAKNINIAAYDEKTRTLYLNIESELCDSLFAHKDSIELVSDLRFLVQNVIDFYAQDIPLALPTTTPTLHPNIDDLRESQPPPHKEQLEALHGIFTSPFCYIWGVAGSGKTKVVLLHALAFYLKAGKKVAILAPTNNALEQCLSTLIISLNDIGIATHTIIRLGVPTQSFAERFPLNCDALALKKGIEAKRSLAKAQIVAMTLDTFLHRDDAQDIDFQHFFVDEAAFAPLIKVLPLCAFNKPLTLLGDHKQLQPISTLSTQDSKAIQWKPSLFWKYSALFVEAFFTSNLNFNDSNHYITPKISHCFTLTQTYRYGDNLAKLLNHYIYKNNLQGRNTHTHLYYLDIAQPPKNLACNTESHTELKERTSYKEAKLCTLLAEDFIAKHLDFAILTPFVNQRQLILKLMPSLFTKDCVFTIHSSQGQEFDYVIFSPVILHYYLNDSNNPNALFALNVALSRARIGIIIVCDRAYWLKQNRQFLGDLMRIAQPFCDFF